MRILIAYPPFCTPASPPYTIARLYSEIASSFRRNGASDEEIRQSVHAIDLNASFHAKRYERTKEKINMIVSSWDGTENRDDLEEYDSVTREFRKISNSEYSGINRQIVSICSVNSDDFTSVDPVKEALDEIMTHKPDVVAFSVVFSSQTIFTYALVKELKKAGIRTAVGGPAVSRKLAEASEHFSDYKTFVKNLHTEDHENHISDTKINTMTDAIPDFSILDTSRYFSPEPVIPLKTSDSCYYRRCAFCTHHRNDIYHEYPLETVRATVLKQLDNGFTKFFIVDDSISRRRIPEIAKIFSQEMESRNIRISWMCQLRTCEDFDFETLSVLKKSGLDAVIWGIESGSERILDLMDKGTTPELNRISLSDSRKAGMFNAAFIMFGFPTERKEEFLETIDFLMKNSLNIDLVLTTVFGLQQGSKVFENPEKFGIKMINSEKRTLLDDSITFEMNDETSTEATERLRNNYKKTIEKINKYPKEFNFFREHMLIFASMK